MNNKSIILTIAGSALLVVLLVGVFSFTKESKGSSEELAALATCLAESGAKFYGAYWCSHCQDQKKWFGDAVKLLPYVECSTPDGRGQTKECLEAGVESYPTWEFPGGQRKTGAIALPSLAEATGCPAPSDPTEKK